MENSTVYSTKMSTGMLPSNQSLEVKLALDIVQNLASVNVVVLMFSLGCAASFQDIKNYLKNPKQFITATLLQLLVMPLLGFATASLFNLTIAAKLGVIIMTIAPGGSYSNIVTYWMDGDISLSVTMTSCSTILSLGTMPMWLFIFSRILNIDAEFQIPFGTIFIALAIATIPVGFALAFKYKFPNAATKIAKYGNLIASLLVIVVLVVVLYFGLFSGISKKIVTVNFVIAIQAVAMGYVASILPCLKFGIAARRTIAIETAFQNAPIALSVGLLSYGSRNVDTMKAVTSFTLIYGLTLVSTSFFTIIIYQTLKWRGIKWVQPIPNVHAESTQNSDYEGEREELEKTET